MKHEWERGVTISTPDNPPEGYSYCAYCCVAEDDDNTDAECLPIIDDQVIELPAPILPPYEA